MPDTLPRPEPAAPAPASLVKRLRLPYRHDKNVDISPPTPARPGSIKDTSNGASASVTKSYGQDTTYFAPRASTFGEHSPLLLSERESIFATHYTPVDNDPSTPRLPPLAGAIADPSSPEALTSDMEFSLPPLVPTPSKLSIRSSLTAAYSGSNPIAGGLRQYGHTNSEKPADKKSPSRNGTIHGIRRVASDGHPWARSSDFRVDYPTQLPGGSQPQASLHGNVMEDDRAQTEASAVKSSHVQEQDHGQGAQRPSAMSQAMRPTRSERSVSRGRSHVDKSIEATLANTEPGQNIRSRKSSHLMGVFRENTSSLESRSRDMHGQPGEETVRSVQSVARSNLPAGRTSSRPTSATTNTGSDIHQKPSPAEDQMIASSSDKRLHSESFLTQDFAVADLPHLQPASPTSPARHDHDPYFRKQDAIKQNNDSQNPPIPANLLEQIREHHNLVPMRSQGSHLPKNRTGFTSNEEPDFVDRRQLRSGDVGGRTDEHEEHISSAVYFPHPTPSLDDIEQFNLSKDDHVITGIRTDTGTPVPAGSQSPTEVKRLSMDLGPPEHIDISVQSKHEKRVFHGDYQPPDETLDDQFDRDILPTITERLTENYTIASDSEVESGDDIGVSSQTDDGETTPTATPILATQPRRAKRASISTGPRGAVVLEPYSHQVGGHSTIFRFSRRAVCKQLNNRENEFYERIERRHPDMLRFLPRYIGVLNVTFSKGPKPLNDASGEVSQDLEESEESQKKLKDALAENMNLDDSNKQKHPSHIADNEQRIVSQSQQIGERPQVILEQNRHIVPFSLFDSAGRSQITEAVHGGDRWTSKLGPAESETNNRQVHAPFVKESSLARPYLPSPPSWGKTTVNSKFGEQILRDVFGPPQIYHHKKHAKGHNTLPRLKEPGIRRKSNLSADPLNQDRRTASIPADERRISAPLEQEETSHADQIRDKSLDIPSRTTQQDTPPASASAFEELSHGLEKIKTTNSISSEGSQKSFGGNKIRRRHSGMGLRRRGMSVHDKSRGNLEYYEEEGYGGDGEQEVFQMEEDGDGSKAVSAGQYRIISQDFKNRSDPTITQTEARKPQDHGNAESSYHATVTNGIATQATPNEMALPNHLPLNPKEAQLAKPDQRVVFFLLLEDLTADMGRPCVLDLKMGTRQYGIEANPKKVESQRRKCKTTTSQQLGVRICGMQTFDVKKQKPAYEDKYFGRDLSAGPEFREALTRFLYDGVSYSSVTKRIPTILDKLDKLESMVRRLPGYRFYASSLLMLYDAEPEKSQKAKEKALKGDSHSEKNDDNDKSKEKRWPPPIELKIVDFANCVTGEDPLPPSAPCPPFHPGTIDRGYLRGLRTLKMYFQRILRDITESEFVDRGDGEATGVDMTGAWGTHGGSESVVEEDDEDVSI